MENRAYKVLGIYDTETTNIEIRPGMWRAFPVLFIMNDLRDVNIRRYEPDVSRENIRFARTSEGFHEWISDLVEYGKHRDVIPVVAAYNLAFDLQPVIYRLSDEYEIKVLARSSTNIYTLDLIQDGESVLRFWDTFHLETAGLAQMGRVAGFAKASGDWDYSLIRHQKTPITEDELGYARRDVQVIPAYLRYLLDTGQVEDPSDFGFRVITKTSLVRQMARREIGRLRVPTNGGTMTLHYLFSKRCKEELPYSYNCYALRKACFRGGFTFTAAATASTIQRNVSSFDVVSMHHLYLNARRQPVAFAPADDEQLEFAFDYIVNRTLEDVLRRYEAPFAHYVNMSVTFFNLRLKKGSVFERQGIALLASGKFSNWEQDALDFEPDMRNVEAENDVRAAGYHDDAINPVFAFGKLVSADVATVHVTEVELWNIAQVYEWDDHAIITGEHTIKSVLPPDYISMQSNVLYQRKNDAKTISNAYDGTPYKADIPASIPESIARELRSGEIDPDIFQTWYQVSVKGSFNGIYGTQAQDQLRPDFLVHEGEFIIDDGTRTTPENFFDKLPKKTTVWYNYGTRIVAGSRQHLIIGALLLDRMFGDKVNILGGDTDSYKIQHPADIKPDDILSAFEPLHDAADRAISICQARNRRLYDQAAPFERLGHFDYEGTQDVHFEAWNKARVSFTDGKAHITCAGLMRPPGLYHIENWIEDLVKQGTSVEAALTAALGYNGTVDNEVCHSRGHYRPWAYKRFDDDVTDYLGDTAHVSEYQSVAIYPDAREVGGIVKHTNEQNVGYLESAYGRKVPKREHYITREDGRAVLYVADDWGMLWPATDITTGTLL